MCIESYKCAAFFFELLTKDLQSNFVSTLNELF